MSSSCSHPSAAPPLQPMSPPPSAKQPESRQDIKPDDNIHSDDTTNPKHQDRCPDKAPRDDGDPPSLPPPPSSSPPTSPTSQFQPSPIRIPTATASSRVRHGHAHDDTTLSHSLHSLHSFASAASLTCPEHDPSPPPPRDDTTDRRGRYAPVHKIPSSSFSSSSSAAPALATGTVPTATAAPSRRPRLVRLEKGCQRADDAEEETMDSSMDDILGHLLAAKEVECGSGAGPGGGHTSWVLTDWEELEKVTDMGSTSTMGTLMGSITGSFTTGGLVANGMRGSFNSGLKGSLTSPNGGGGENLKGSLVGRTGFVSRVDSIIETPGDVSSSSIFNGSESFFDLGVSAECVGARGEHGRKATNDTFQDDHLEEESSKVDVGANGQSTFEKTPTTSKKFTNVTKERNEKNNKTSHQSKKFPNCLNNSSNSSNTKTQKETNTINRQESVDDSYHETTRKPRMSVQEMLMMDFNRLSSSEHSKDDSHDGTTRTSERRAENSRGRRLERERKSEGGNTDFDDDVHSNEKEGDGEAKGRRHSSSSTGGGRRSGLMRKLSRRDVSLAYQSRDWNRNEGVGSGTAAAIDGSATGDCYAAGTSLSSNALANNDGDATATNPTTNSMKFPTFPTSTFRSSPTPQKRTAILHLPTPPPPISPSSSIE